jgi:hypothetical protein
MTSLVLGLLPVERTAAHAQLVAVSEVDVWTWPIGCQ